MIQITNFLKPINCFKKTVYSIKQTNHHMHFKSEVFKDADVHTASKRVHYNIKR